MDIDDIIEEISKRESELPSELIELLRHLLERLERIEADVAIIRDALARPPARVALKKKTKTDQEFLERLVSAKEVGMIEPGRKRLSDFVGKWKDLTPEEEAKISEREKDIAEMWKRWAKPPP